MGVAAVLLAGGSGARVGADRNKVLLALAGEPLLAHSLRRAAGLAGVAVVVVVVRPGDEDDVSRVVGDLGVPVVTAPGGATRHASELSALGALRPRIEAGDVDVVAVHDAARPLASAALWAAVVDAARRHGGAVPVRPAVGVVAADGLTAPAPDEQWATVQTPQAFSAGPLLDAYLAAERDDVEGTDTAACVARYSDLHVTAVPGEATNLKVTFADDLPLAERLLRGPSRA